MRQKGISMNFMNNNTNPIIIGIDHGYGNIKTAHCCFKTGVAAYDKEPTFKSNLLVYEGRYYLIGEEHKEFISDKMTDSDYYILTLAAVAREPNIRKLTSARVPPCCGNSSDLGERAKGQLQGISSAERQRRLHFQGR